jgi:hypothetical protein
VNELSESTFRLESQFSSKPSEEDFVKFSISENFLKLSKALKVLRLKKLPRAYLDEYFITFDLEVFLEVNSKPTLTFRADTTRETHFPQPTTTSRRRFLMK